MLRAMLAIEKENPKALLFDYFNLGLWSICNWFEYKVRIKIDPFSYQYPIGSVGSLHLQSSSL